MDQKPKKEKEAKEEQRQPAAEKPKKEEKPKEEKPTPATEKPKKEEKPKEEKPTAATEKPTTCSKCGKGLSRKHWYYRNGKYYCNKRCWKAVRPLQKK